jgi:phosphoglycolate phosphatase/putative hydrolase of the HAD superfamily
MEKEPLDLVAKFARPGLRNLLDTAKSAGLKLGICSDYPSHQKLRALGVDSYFDVVVHAQDRDVLRFKPDIAGLRKALDALRIRPDEAIYIGDRADVDAAAAARAGMRCVLIGSERTADCETVRDFEELNQLLFESTVRPNSSARA